VPFGDRYRTTCADPSHGFDMGPVPRDVTPICRRQAGVSLLDVRPHASSTQIYRRSATRRSARARFRRCIDADRAAALPYVIFSID
jgi:hypothetical protein